jgi:hypothetical protein
VIQAGQRTMSIWTSQKRDVQTALADQYSRGEFKPFVTFQSYGNWHELRSEEWV